MQLSVVALNVQIHGKLQRYNISQKNKIIQEAIRKLNTVNTL